MFSLLPPDNATGNFTKIVQRLPVRIRVPADIAAEGLLRPGLSVVVRVDTRDGADAPLLRTAGSSPAPKRRGVRRAQAGLSRQAARAGRSGPAVGDAAAEPPLDNRRLFAFLCMVFGMFMAILDIQIVSASLNEIQAGLSASGDEIPWVQTSYLIAEVISIPLSGYAVAGALDPLDVRHLGRRLHRS